MTGFDIKRLSRRVFTFCSAAETPRPFAKRKVAMFSAIPSASISLGHGPSQKNDVCWQPPRVVAISHAVPVFFLSVTVEGLVTIHHWKKLFGPAKEIRRKIKRPKRNRSDGSRVAIEHSKTFDSRPSSRAEINNLIEDLDVYTSWGLQGNSSDFEGLSDKSAVSTELSRLQTRRLGASK